MSIAIYNELAQEKDVSLLRADFVPHITKQEAVALTKMFVDGYARNKDTQMCQFIEAFNLKPETFNFEDYIAYTKSSYFSLFQKRENSTSIE